MLDRSNDIQQKNIELLIKGYWYEDLPPVIGIDNMTDVINKIIEEIEDDKYTDFGKTDSIITKYKNTEAPTYIFNDGIESITFFEFKKKWSIKRNANS